MSLIGLLLISGFLTEGLRIAVTELNPQSELYDPSAAPWSFIGYLFALAFRAGGITQYGGEVSHFIIYWLHVLLVTISYAYITFRFTKIAHIFFAPLNCLIMMHVPIVVVVRINALHMLVENLFLLENLFRI